MEVYGIIIRGPLVQVRLPLSFFPSLIEKLKRHTDFRGTLRARLPVGRRAQAMSESGSSHRRVGSSPTAAVEWRSSFVHSDKVTHIMALFMIYPLPHMMSKAAGTLGRRLSKQYIKNSVDTAEGLLAIYREKLEQAFFQGLNLEENVLRAILQAPVCKCSIKYVNRKIKKEVGGGNLKESNTFIKNFLFKNFKIC
jgi:hypothetical protein